MGLVRTEITLRNGDDLVKAKGKLISDNEIRQIKVNALVDTGAWTMVINEEMREKLGLEVTRVAPGTLADGSTSTYNLVGPLEIMWKDRGVICEAILVPNADESLLGAIPLEAMDLTVNPRTQEVVGVHGDQIMHSVRKGRL